MSLAVGSMLSGNNQMSELTEGRSPFSPIHMSSEPSFNCTANDAICHSPTTDFGKDFTFILRKCTHDRGYKSQKRKWKDCHDNQQATMACEQDDPGEIAVLTPTATEVCEDTQINNADNGPEIVTSTEEDAADMSVSMHRGKGDTSYYDPSVRLDGVPLPGRKCSPNDTESKAVLCSVTNKMPNQDHRPKKQVLDNRKRKEEKIKSKKWKSASIDMLSFQFSLLPWQKSYDITTEEMDRELEHFEISCMTENDMSTKEKNESLHPQDTKSSEDMEKVPKKYSLQEDCDDESDYDSPLSRSHDIFHLRWNFECMVSARDLNVVLDMIYGRSSGQANHLRHKKKWRIQKAHKQIKNKYCTQVTNQPHGLRLYVHHRIARLMPMIISKYDSGRLSVKKLHIIFDQSVDPGRAPSYQPRAETNGASNPVVSRRTPAPRVVNTRRNPAPLYALNAYNADSNLEADLVNILIGIQDRDLTPEDYDLLLRLDEHVAAKTVSEKCISSLKTDAVPQEVAGDSCTICMEEFVLDTLRKHLPCGHFFHEECVNQWLRTSTTCPLDGLEVSS